MTDNKTQTQTTDVTNKDVETEKDYWKTFYSKANIPSVPSQFCALVATEINKSTHTSIVEFGCGNGRDSEYFSSLQEDLRVFGSDLSEDVITKNSIEKTRHGAEFFVCDCTDEKDVGNLIEKAHNNTNGNNDTNKIVVYNRFFLHTIDEKQEEKFLTALGHHMKTDDKLYMEFRCDLDEALPKVYGTSHYRRYVVTKDLVEFLKTLSFDIEYERTGQGMAKYKNEDPFVSRIIAVKK